MRSLEHSPAIRIPTCAPPEKQRGMANIPSLEDLFAPFRKRLDEIAAERKEREEKKEAQNAKIQGILSIAIPIISPADFRSGPSVITEGYLYHQNLSPKEKRTLNEALVALYKQVEEAVLEISPSPESDGLYTMLPTERISPRGVTKASLREFFVQNPTGTFVAIGEIEMQKLESKHVGSENEEQFTLFGERRGEKNSEENSWRREIIHEIFQDVLHNLFSRRGGKPAIAHLKYSLATAIKNTNVRLGSQGYELNNERISMRGRKRKDATERIIPINIDKVIVGGPSYDKEYNIVAVAKTPDNVNHFSSVPLK